MSAEQNNFTLNVVFRTCLSLPRTKTHPSLSATCTTTSLSTATVKATLIINHSWHLKVEKKIYKDLKWLKLCIFKHISI